MSENIHPCVYGGPLVDDFNDSVDYLDNDQQNDQQNEQQEYDKLYMKYSKSEAPHPCVYSGPPINDFDGPVRPCIYGGSVVRRGAKPIIAFVFILAIVVIAIILWLVV